MLLLQFGESWQAFCVSGFTSSPPPLFLHWWFLTDFSVFFFFFSTWLNHISFKASREPWAQAAPGCVCSLESEQISSLREWNLFFTRHGPHTSHPSLVSFLWLILVSSLLPCPSNFLPKTGTDLTSLCQNQEHPVLAKEFHMVNFLSLQTLTFQCCFLLPLFSLFQCYCSCGGCSNLLTTEGFPPGISATQSIMGGYDLNLESTGRECVKVHFSY